MVDSYYDGPVSDYAERNGIRRGTEPMVAVTAEDYNGLKNKVEDLRAELAASKDAATIKILRDELSRAQEALNVAACRARVAEAKLFEAGEAYAKQAEELRVAEAERDEAHATIARVEAALSHPAVLNGTEGAGYHVRRALEKPKITLPSEAGAVIEYTDHDGDRRMWFRTRGESRPWVDVEGNTWHDVGVAGDIEGDFIVMIEGAR